MRSSRPTPATECLTALQDRQESTLALVGHQPQLSGLASLLLAGERALSPSRAEEGRSDVPSLRRRARGGSRLLALEREPEGARARSGAER